MKIKDFKRLQNNCRALSICRGCRFIDGEGPKNAKIILIGQNPGAEEDKSGRPFVGRSGKYLNEVLKKNGIDRSRIFITSVVKCKTPKNRMPNKDEVKACMPYLIEQIKKIKPKLVVLMGSLAWRTPKIAEIRYFKTYHPAAAMRFLKIRRKFEKDFNKIKQILHLL